MSAKIHHIGDDGMGGQAYVFHCPGCGYGHHFAVPRWTWNGSMDAPTITPSMLVNAHDAGSRCHFLMTGGRLQFLGDCAHALAGKTVDMDDWE